jgi:hypothetical protein
VTASGAALLDALGDAARDLGDVETVTTADGAAFTWHGTVFAAVHGAIAEFELEPVIARAARGTPATAASPRGADWVVFAPPELDRFARDRAVAWFGSAYRRAVSRSA